MVNLLSLFSQEERAVEMELKAISEYNNDVLLIKLILLHFRLFLLPRFHKTLLCHDGEWGVDLMLSSTTSVKTKACSTCTVILKANINSNACC